MIDSTWRAELLQLIDQKKATQTKDTSSFALISTVALLGVLIVWTLLYLRGRSCAHEETLECEEIAPTKLSLVSVRGKEFFVDDCGQVRQHIFQLLEHCKVVAIIEEEGPVTLPLPSHCVLYSDCSEASHSLVRQLQPCVHIDADETFTREIKPFVRSVLKWQADDAFLLDVVMCCDDLQ
ncbi:MAG: uncharacterized protein KVP18_005220 [Porospora cf. gigantea A]|uniref:uncharacterized protein n=1 Tax=Porospora cf. gigantea A TaxID=2853593 RepID=UPI00355939F0|nr:MAG: hypothetical protein KVP18_005220 [Porospora cf. gigantea A]